MQWLGMMTHGQGPRVRRRRKANVSGPRPRVIAGRYFVEGKARRSGLGQAFPALDVERDERVELKTPLDHPTALAAFVAESHALSELSHPGVVVADRMVLYNDSWYLPRTSWPCSWKELSERTSVTERVRALLEQVLPTLAYLDRHGYIHNDVGPATLRGARIDGEIRVVLADFSFVELRHDEARSGLIAGRGRTIAPESLLGVRDARRDVFAVGRMILAELLAARAVYRIEPQVAPAELLRRGESRERVARLIEARTQSDLEEARAVNDARELVPPAVLDLAAELVAPLDARLHASTAAVRGALLI